MLYMYTYELMSIGWLVGCGLTSHSAIFQLYIVTEQEFRPAARHTTPWQARGS